MRSLLLIPLLAATLTGPVHAKDGEGQPGTAEKPAESKKPARKDARRSIDLPRSTQGHRGQDLNGDGVISRDEWPGNDQSFRQEDRNGDGVISDADRKLAPKAGNSRVHSGNR